MAFTERISVVIDAITNGAKSGLDSLRGSTDAAEVSTSKLKSGVGGLSDKLLGAATSPAGLAAGAAALVGIAAEGIGKFQNLGIEVGNFSTVTGLSTDQASRWIEVAGDHGVATDTVEAAIGRMNKTAGLSPGVFDNLGVAIVHAKDGTIDSEATFKNAIDVLHNTDDAARQAEIGTALFGKGWQGMAGLISEGAPKLTKDLASVQASKVFTPEDVASAKSLRDAFDSIKDAGEGLLLTLGRSLAPTIATVATELGAVFAKAEPLVKLLGDSLAKSADALNQSLGPLLDGLAVFAGETGKASEKSSLFGEILKVAFTGGLGLAGEGLKATTDAIREFHDGVGRGAAEQIIAQGVALDGMTASLNLSTQAFDLSGLALNNYGTDLKQARQANIVGKEAIDQSTQAAKHAADVLNNQMAGAAKRAQDNIDKLTGAYDALKGSVDDDQAYIDLENTFDDVRDKAKEAWDAAQSGADDADQKMRDYQSTTNSLKGDIINLASEVANIDPETTKKLLMEVDKGQLDAVQAQIETIRRNNTITLQIIAKGGAGYGSLVGNVPRATGGTVGTNEWVTKLNEIGPELLTLPSGTEVMTAAATAAYLATKNAGGTGGTTNNYYSISTHAGLTASDLAAELRRRERRNGA